MKIGKICVIGGSGLVGRQIVGLLAAQGCEVLVPTRHADRAKALLVLPTVEVVEADVHDQRALDGLLAGCGAAINLVGILHGTQQAFIKTHVELPRKIAAACRAQGVQRLLHMSALNADAAGSSAYLRSKGEGEAVVRASGLATTIFRPSVIFGRDDHFLNLFAGMLKFVPILPLAMPNARFQPVFVGDVAHAFAAALDNAHAVGQSYDLCGPLVYTLRQLVEYVGRLTNRRRLIIGLGDTLSYWQAWLFEHLPGKLMTRDNYYSMHIDSVCNCPFPFGIEPTQLAAAAPTWLVGHAASSARHGRNVYHKHFERR